MVSVKIWISGSFLEIWKSLSIFKPPTPYATYTMRKKCPYSEFFWSIYSGIRTEYGEILRISPYSVRMPENTDEKNSEYGHFSRSNGGSIVQSN